MQWYKDGDQHFVLSGYAGTGKTTLAKYIADVIGKDDVYFCAYTGKAANVLREKGCENAATIHSHVYRFLYDKDGKNPVFGFNHDSELRQAKLVIVDEYSMLNDTIIQDIHRLAKKVLYLGDPFQLPPVKDVRSMLEPDCFLEEVHRQALNSPILRAATDVRLGRNISIGDHGEFVYEKRGYLTNQMLLDADQVICGINRTRYSLNAHLRKLRGHSEFDFFTKDEKVMCLRNNRDNGLFNGMMGICRSCDDSNRNYVTIDFECDGHIYYELKVARCDVEKKPAEYDSRSRLERFDYGHVITCHKAQGSEFNSVVVIKEAFGDTLEDRRKWTYTALTRAKNKLILIEP